MITLQNPIGMYFAKRIITRDGHQIEKRWRRISLHNYIFDAVFDVCEEVARAEQRYWRYLLKGM